MSAMSDVATDLVLYWRQADVYTLRHVSGRYTLVTYPDIMLYAAGDGQPFDRVEYAVHHVMRELGTAR